MTYILPVRYAIPFIISSKESKIPFLLAVLLRKAEWRRLVFILLHLVWSAEKHKREQLRNATTVGTGRISMEGSSRLHLHLILHQRWAWRAFPDSSADPPMEFMDFSSCPTSVSEMRNSHQRSFGPLSEYVSFAWLLYSVPSASACDMDVLQGRVKNICSLEISRVPQGGC